LSTARRWLPLAAATLAGFVLLATIGAVSGWLLAGGAGGDADGPDPSAATTGARTPRPEVTAPGQPAPAPELTPSTKSTLPRLPPGRVRLPDLVGRDFREARHELRRLGLGWNLAFGVAGDDPTVARTDPAPGTAVKRGTVVRISVLGAAPAVPVPDLTGLLCVRAAAKLTDVGLVPRYSTGRLGQVTRQEPQPGTELRWNDQVVLHCGAPHAEPSVTARPVDQS
jgi:hypothetical protein